MSRMIFDAAEVRRSIELFSDPEAGFELMALPTGVSYTAFEKDVDAIGQKAAEMPSGSGIYFRLNPVKPGAAKAASDRDIVCRRWLFIDVDPKKPEGFTDDSATNDEKNNAEALCETAREYLIEAGWPRPVIVDSGNGFWLLYGCELPNDEVTRDAIRGFLQALSNEFSGAQGAIDTQVFNAGRLAKLPGTWARKGKHTEERPHRPCRLILVPESSESVTLELIQKTTSGLVERTKAKNSPSEPFAIKQSANGTHHKNAGPYAQAAFNKEIANVAMSRSPAQGGLGRNNTLNVAAFNLGQFVAIDALERGAVERRLFEAACACGLDAADGGERAIHSTILSGIEAGLKKPRVIAERAPPVPVFGSRNHENLGVDREAAASQSRFKFADSAEFLAGDYRLEYLVPRVLVKGQPAVIGGPSKTLKTSIMIDLAVSMATTTPFLGKFPVHRRTRVAIVSGESGEFTLKETCLRILRAKGIEPASLSGWLKWEFRLPVFTDSTVMLDFAEQLCALEAEVVMIDPTYLALGEADAKDIFNMGRVLRPVAEVLLSRGITPLLAHHANRMLPVGEVMGLEHLSHAGLAEFSRQWLLLNRREKYAGDGNHALWVNIGGSAGHGGIWALDIEEGVLDEGFTNRRWDVSLRDLNEVASTAAESREESKREKAVEKIAHEQAAVMLAIDAECATVPAATKTKIKERTGYNPPRATEVINAMLEEGAIEEHEFEKSIGNNAKRKVVGYRRVKVASGTSEQM